MANSLSATITVVDKQKVSDKPKAPYKIQAADGFVFKAWPDVAVGIHAGATYHISYENKANGEYGDEHFIKSFTKAAEGGSVPNIGGPAHSSGEPRGIHQNIAGPVHLAGGGPAKPIVDWAAKEEDMATLALFKASWPVDFNQGMSKAQCLDDCRLEWKAHKARMKAAGPNAMRTTVNPPQTAARPEDDLEF